ncbi:MAG: 4-hydroxythreonine-4-phosphate dehydrogenase PdxA [Planctomycetes bacterium]|nr:4-hydroxythreonine-4-phosphate dehydrogenase PdxA [Planctomycetota bacterium]
MCLGGAADALLPPPTSKKSMHLAGYAFEGQTQIVGELCGSRRYGMLACNGALRVLLATRHMSLRQAVQSLEINLVEKQIRIAHEAAREVLGIPEPRGVLSGLNPHASEDGAFGTEERKILAPAIRRAREEWGYQTAGPAVPDVVFAEAVHGLWDVVIALYHDQAFIPLKLLGRETAYTVFVGGSILRVSPMHGTAFDLARSGAADPASFAFALDRTLELCAARAARVVAG